MPDEYFFNGEFDTALAGNSPPGSLIRAAGRMNLHFLLAAGPGDSIITRCNIPVEFSEYLATCGIAAGNFTPPGKITPDACLIPFGWDKRAVNMQSRYRKARQIEYPDLNVVRMVNSKRFSFEIARSIGEGATESRLFCSKEKILEFVKKLQDQVWVLKSFFGSAGAGNRQIGKYNRVSEKWIDRVLVTGGAVIAEPWRNRTRDYGVNFILNREGIVQNCTVHELLNSSAGKYMGVILEKAPSISPKYFESLMLTAQSAAKALYSQGYFGPVGIDAFEWYDEKGDCHLRSLVEINARQSMTLPAYRLKAYLNEQSCLIWRMYSSGRFYFPSNYRDWLTLQNQMSSGKNAKFLLTSPLEIQENDRATLPDRLSVIFFGKDRISVMNLMGQFESRICKT